MIILKNGVSSNAAEINVSKSFKLVVFIRIYCLLLVCYRPLTLLFSFLPTTIVNCVELHCVQPTPPACIVNETINAKGEEITSIFFETNAESVYLFELTKPSVLITFPQIIFEKFPSLGRVELNEVGLEDLNQQSLVKATNLKVLNLRGNKLRIIRSSTFIHTPALRKLDLSRNEIAEIEDDAFKQLEALRSLNLSGNKIKIIKRLTLSGLENLKNLDLSFNEIETIEEDALKTTKLTEISLSDNKLKTISDNLFIDARRVEIIDLSNNQLVNFGRSFDRLNSLFLLNLTNNDKLENLSLMTFVYLPELRKLALDNTGFKFATVPSDEDMPPEEPGLIKLSLGSNQLSNADIFKHLKMFPKLRGLYLENNAFTHFDDIDQVKKTFPDFRILDLKFNKNAAINDWVKTVEEVLKENNIEVEV